MKPPPVITIDLHLLLNKQPVSLEILTVYMNPSNLAYNLPTGQPGNMCSVAQFTDLLNHNLFLLYAAQQILYNDPLLDS
jgi:hypothetical protein